MTGLPLRQQIFLAVALPAIVLMAALCLVTWTMVRSDRLAALDADLAARGAGIAAMVERDSGVWEVDLAPESAPALLAGLRGWEIRAGREVVATQGTVAADGNSRGWTGEFDVEDDRGGAEDEDEDVGEVEIEITLVADLTPLNADLRVLLAVLSALVATFGLVAVGIARVLSHRIVDPLHQMAERAEAVRVPIEGDPLPQRGAGDEVDRLAGTLNRTFARLHEAWQRQARFTADASHELRTPLSVARSAAEVALRRERTADQYREALTDVVSATERMKRTLEGLLVLARTEGGGAEKSEKVDLAQVAREVVEGLPVEARLDDAVFVRGDATQLAIVIQNLVSNALRHTPAEGTVRVAVRVEDAFAVLEVADTGEGIPAADLPHIFDRFFRVDSARTRQRGGAGLGLSIVRAIAERHGGVVSAESEVGRGTTIRVQVPLSPGA